MNDNQQMFHGKKATFHDGEDERVKRLKKYSAGSKLGARRKRSVMRQRIKAIADKDAS